MEHEAEQDPSVLMRAAVVQVTRLTKAVNRYRIFVIILGAVCAALIAGGVVLGITYGNTENALTTTRSVVHRQAQQNYSGCLLGNDFRSGNQQIWNYFIELATQGNPSANSKGTQEVIHKLLAFVAKVETPRNCKPLLSGG